MPPADTTTGRRSACWRNILPCTRQPTASSTPFYYHWPTSVLYGQSVKLTIICKIHRYGSRPPATADQFNGTIFLLPTKLYSSSLEHFLRPEPWQCSGSGGR